MAETTTSQETRTETTSEAIPSFLQLKSVEELRRLQAERVAESLRIAYENKKHGLVLDPEKIRAEEYAKFDHLIENYLALNGITPGDDEAQRRQYQGYATFLREQAIDHISEDEWDFGRVDDQGRRTTPPASQNYLAQAAKFKSELVDPATEAAEQARREQAERERQEAEAERARVAAENAERERKIAEEAERKRQEAKKDHLTPEQLEKLKDIRERFSVLVADRSKNVLNKRGMEEAITNTRQELSEAINEIAQEVRTRLSAEGMSDEDIARELEALIAEEVDATVSRVEGIRAQEFSDRNKLTQWTLTKWAKWGGGGNEKWYSRERIKGNMKKSLFLAPVGVAAGATTMVLAAPLAGLAASGIIAGGTVALTRSVARRMVGAKLDAASGVQTVAAMQAEDMRERIRGAHTAGESQALHDDLLKIIQEQSEQYRKRNRSRLIGGLAIAGTIGMVTGTGLEVAHASGVGDKFGDWAGRMIDRFGNKGTNTSTGKTFIGPSASSTTSSTIDSLYGTPDQAAIDKSIQEAIEKSSAALEIDRGEGWYQTFKEMGVKPGDRAELLRLTGPKLVEEGIAYKDPDIGGYGIYMTENDQMPAEALKIIADTAHEHDIETNYSALYVAHDTPSMTPHEAHQAHSDHEAHDTHDVHKIHEAQDTQTETTDTLSYKDALQEGADAAHVEDPAASLQEGANATVGITSDHLVAIDNLGRDKGGVAYREYLKSIGVTDLATQKELMETAAQQLAGKTTAGVDGFVAVRVSGNHWELATTPQNKVPRVVQDQLKAAAAQLLANQRAA